MDGITENYKLQTRLQNDILRSWWWWSVFPTKSILKYMKEKVQITVKINENIIADKIVIK